MYIKISAYKPPWKYNKNIVLSKVFLKLHQKIDRHWTLSLTVAMFRLKLRIPRKHNKQNFNRANQIFVRFQLIASEGGMALFSDNSFDNIATHTSIYWKDQGSEAVLLNL